MIAGAAIAGHAIASGYGSAPVELAPAFGHLCGTVEISPALLALPDVLAALTAEPELVRAINGKPEATPALSGDVEIAQALKGIPENHECDQ